MVATQRRPDGRHRASRVIAGALDDGDDVDGMPGRPPRVADRPDQGSRPMDLMAFYEQSIRDLRQRGDFRFFKQMQPDTSNPAVAIYTDETGRRSEVTVWCNNDYLG